LKRLRFIGANLQVSGLQGTDSALARKHRIPIPLRGIGMRRELIKPAGQRLFLDQWQVQDSNLRSNTATDLRASATSVVACGFTGRLQTSSRIPHNQRHTVSDSWTEPGSPENRLGLTALGCSTCAMATFPGATSRSQAHQMPHYGTDR
jgi:hypothetical protein